MGNYSKRDCPKLKQAEPQKDKQMHKLQVLSLDLSLWFPQVQVSHMDVRHECHLTSSMWQPTFGPHDLVHMHGKINDHKACILIDDGALHNFLNYKVVKKLKL